LRFDSSNCKDLSVCSLDEYIERLPEGQNEIFYLCVPSRPLAEASPYYEAFKAKNKEVLFLYASIDDFVMTNLGTYKGKKLCTVESAEASAALENKEPVASKMSVDEIKEFCNWMKDVLASKASSVKDSTRLVDSPAIIVDHESASFRRMMKYVDPARSPTVAKQPLEVNTNHPIIIKLNDQRKSKPEVCKIIAEQIYDGALVAAGLMDDARGMMPRINQLMNAALDGTIPAITEVASSTTEATSTTTAAETTA